MYLCLAPGNVAHWSGVLFVRKGEPYSSIYSRGSKLKHSGSGPYAPAVLRFQVAFPPSYPEFPPTIVFTSDIFHPLVTPLTTYTHSAGTAGSDTVSANDDERLPPGGFSLRYAFPTWFDQVKHRIAWSTYSKDSIAFNETLGPNSESRKSCIVDVLEYVKTAFDDASTLDDLPFEAAGNPGAWKAWRAHRKRFSEDEGKISDTGSNTSESMGHPSEWNWDGVWQDRVRKGIDASISAPVLYGSSGHDDPVSFKSLDVAGFDSNAVTRYVSQKLMMN